MFIKNKCGQEKIRIYPHHPSPSIPGADGHDVFQNVIAERVGLQTLVGTIQSQCIFMPFHTRILQESMHNFSGPSSFILQCGGDTRVVL